MSSNSVNKSIISISIIFCFRMFGLFVMIPIFSPYLNNLANATPYLIGLTMGVYGLTQAILQIPFGILSDYIGRKEVITIGLIIFFIGCIVAASSNNIWLIMLGRALQGAGAISGTLMALLSDLTSEESRTKAMAYVGMSIGASFMLAFILGPILSNYLSINNIFYLIAILVMPIIYILWHIVPNNFSNNTSDVNTGSPDRLTGPIRKIFNNKSLLKKLMLYSFGIFSLHGILTINFMALPIILSKYLLVSKNLQSLIYLIIFSISAIFMLITIIYSEKNKKQNFGIFIAISLLVLSSLFFCLLSDNFWSIVLGMVIFFTGFNILEASLPSAISKLVNNNIRGAAMGLYSSAQFMGPMIGGIIAGIVFKNYSLTAVFYISLLWASLWLTLWLVSRMTAARNIVYN